MRMLMCPPYQEEKAYREYLIDSSLASLLHLEGHKLAVQFHSCQLYLKTIHFWLAMVADIWEELWQGIYSLGVLWGHFIQKTVLQNPD